MSEEAILRVDELVRQNNIKYKGIFPIIKTNKTKKPMNLLSRSTKKSIRKNLQNTMLQLWRKETEEQYKRQSKLE